MINVRLLSFEGCPNALPAQELIEAVIHDLGIEASVIHTRVNSEEDADKYQFLGSPTIQVDGKDIEKSRRSEKSLFGCRIYKSADLQTGVPPRQMLEAAIREALAK